MSKSDEALWGEDAAAVRAASEALFGHHPERGGHERDQAAFAVVQAIKERDERITKESAKALIDDANRWAKAYEKARDALRDAHEELCGCDQPGRTAYCVTSSAFVVLNGDP